MKLPTTLNGLAVSELLYSASKSNSKVVQPPSKSKECHCALPSNPAREARNMAQIARTLKAGDSDIIFEGLSEQFCDHCRTVFESEFEKHMRDSHGQ